MVLSKLDDRCRLSNQRRRALFGEPTGPVAISQLVSLNVLTSGKRAE